VVCELSGHERIEEHGFVATTSVGGGFSVGLAAFVGVEAP
jgi:hypothetical protein